jgi:hypothetical protein
MTEMRKKTICHWWNAFLALEREICQQSKTFRVSRHLGFLDTWRRFSLHIVLLRQQRRFFEPETDLLANDGSRLIEVKECAPKIETFYLNKCAGRWTCRSTGSMAD